MNKAKGYIRLLKNVQVNEILFQRSAEFLSDFFLKEWRDVGGDIK